MAHKPVRTHSFKLGRYFIDEDRCEGFCDVPTKYHQLHMHILKGKGIRSLISALHEAMHAEGVPATFLDNGRDSAEHIAKFLWRLGWRRK
jgi:hypothetical protein